MQPLHEKEVEIPQEPVHETVSSTDEGGPPFKEHGDTHAQQS